MLWWCSRLIKKQSRAAASTVPWEHKSTQTPSRYCYYLNWEKSNEPSVITPSLLHSAGELFLPCTGKYLHSFQRFSMFRKPFVSQQAALLCRTGKGQQQLSPRGKHLRYSKKKKKHHLRTVGTSLGNHIIAN